MSYPETKTFEIGLVMAGAVSAGAYTAGVVDFLMQALRAYDKARKANPELNLHNVTIPVISGASAGGVTGSLLLSAMSDADYEPLADFNPETITQEQIRNNAFYRAWVDKKEGVDISYLLENSDIQQGKPLQSLLNSQRLEEVASKALSHPRELQHHYAFIPSRVDLFLSVFNLHGVPYEIAFGGTKDCYGMIMHSDMMHFVMGDDAHSTPNEILLPASPLAVLEGSWELLKTSALATSAFPMALQSRVLSKDRSGYDYWRWPVPSGESECDEGYCTHLINVPPSWNGECKEGYRFRCVDGGTANNEPLEIARRKLAGGDQFNPRDKDKAHRALIMIDPFPMYQEPETCDVPNGSLLSDMGLILSGLKEQARFKPEAFELAADEAVFSRFMVAPSRPGAKRGEALACASLDAFGGFFSEQFRQHDFQLGRRNCQNFLKKYFVVGVENPLVKPNLEWYRAQGAISTLPSGEEVVQIIPLMEEAKAPIPLIPYESVAMNERELDGILDLISVRVETMIEKWGLLEDMINDIAKRVTSFRWCQALIRWILHRFKSHIRHIMGQKVHRMVGRLIREKLRARGLLRD